MTLQDLKKEIPFKWRVQSTNQYGCTCVAYIDARDVQDMFDEVCGAANWQCKYEEHKGNLFCSIGVDMEQDVSDGDTYKGNQWVWKSDCGTESNIEKQKGESSDAFKRAAVMWGVGRFLYSLKIIKIKEVIKDGKDRNGKDKYAPALNGQKIWDVNKHCNEIHLGKARPAIQSTDTDGRPNLSEANYHLLLLPENAKLIPQYLKAHRMGADWREKLEKINA